MKRLIILIILFSFSSLAYPCFCGWNGPFISMAEDSTYVIQGKVIRHNSYGEMDFIIEKSFAGKINEKIIKINAVTSCDERITKENFPNGSRWFLALEESGFSDSNSGAYSISICGTYSLKIIKNYVIGRINTKKYKDPLQKMLQTDFIKLLKEELED